MEILSKNWNSYKTFKNYDLDFIKSLFDAFSNHEGSTFNTPNLKEQKKQIEFHKKCFSILNPKNILEVGTHKCHYGYFCKKEIPSVKITTFGIDSSSQICVDMVNDYFGENFIKFYYGDSKQTLTEYTSDDEFDLAWVDGGHNMEDAYSDLNNCARLGIKNILVDDIVLIPSVKFAVDKFLSENSQYKIVDQSNDERGIVWISSTIN